MPHPPIHTSIIQAHYPHGTGVATSCARSMRGGPFKHPRLTACARETLPLRDLDHHDRLAEALDRPQQIPLPMADFLQRILQHVPPPPPHTQVVRSCGYYIGRPCAPHGVTPTWTGAPSAARALVCTGSILRRGVAPPALSEEYTT